MRRHEQRSWLREHGFVLVRNGARHEVWVHPATGFRTVCPYGTHPNQRAWRNEVARMRREGVLDG